MHTNLATERAPEEVVAAFGLPGSSPGTGRRLEEAVWANLVARMKRERMEGLLAAAMDAGALPSLETRLEEVRALGRARARVDLELERETLRTLRTLECAAVEYRLLKGPALAHTVYPDPMWRGFGDVDVLVGPESWYTAVSILEESGARRVVPEVRPGFDVRFGKDATLVSASGWEIDLHRRLVVGPYGFWAAAEELFENGPATLLLGGRNVSVLEAEDAFLLACYSAALADDPPRLIALRDVAQIAFSGTLDVDKILDTVGRWKGSQAVARALSLSESRLGVPVSETPIGLSFGRVKSRRTHRALMAVYRGPGRGYTSQLAGVFAVRGGRDKLAYLRALARPQDSYLRARGLSPLGFILHAVRRTWSHR